MGRPRKNNSTYYSNNRRKILEAAAMTTQLKYGDIMKFMVIDKNDLTQMAWYAQGRYMCNEADCIKRCFLNARRVMYQYVLTQLNHDPIKQALYRNQIERERP